MNKIMKVIAISLFWIVVLTACAGEMNPSPDSDSDEQFVGGTIPVDRNVYVINGTVVADVENLSQTKAEGIMGAAGMNGSMYASGSYAMWQEGKGFVRISVDSITPNNDTVNDGDIVIAKTTDQKIMALMPGDRVVFKCRLQYESIAAVVRNEKFDDEKLGTVGTGLLQNVDSQDR